MELLKSDERAHYARQFHASCLVSQRTDRLSRHLSEEQRAEYCDCAAARSAETLTLEELGTMLRTGQLSAIRGHLEAVRDHCGEKLMHKWLRNVR